MIEYTTAELRCELLGLEIVELGEVVGQKRLLVEPGIELEGLHVVEVHPTHLQFNRARIIALVELAVARRVPVSKTVGTGVVDAVVGPVPVHLTIVTIRRPGSLVIAMSIRVDIP